MSTVRESASQFDWSPQPAAAEFVERLVSAFHGELEEARVLGQRLTAETGTRFVDWIDSMSLPDSIAVGSELGAVGFVESGGEWVHPGGIFPRVRLGSSTFRIELRVDSVVDFLARHRLDAEPEGIPLARQRRSLAFRSRAAELWVIERCGSRDAEASSTASFAVDRLTALERFRLRTRVSSEESFAGLGSLAEDIATKLGRDVACELFFEAERDYWESRNRAARVQHDRQNRLGMGWANHDHHTYRSSRRFFRPMIEFFHRLGFESRERFYAGREAGWGAQVLEDPATGIVIFADVDLSPEELATDFSREALPERDSLGTVGLWCALHGESIFEAGMHHLECQFDFDSLRDQLAAEAGIQTMRPFTDFPHLRQAFTAGERWAVDPARVDHLLDAGLIDASQADEFRRDGAIGSHLENLERNDGFKGFNQSGVSEIILATDPRAQAASKS
ncbi:MAG: hypothetical protein AAF517_02245 [Planctomycetota bacterium]